jgi:hypothetical protein
MAVPYGCRSSAVVGSYTTSTRCCKIVVSPHTISHMFRMLLIVTALAVAWFGYQRIQSRNKVATELPTAVEERVIQPPSWHGHTPEEKAKATTLPNIPQSASFTCDGRTHCSQMRSCDEAKYFLRNCPGTKMDGDGDGIPCEGQWCSN